MNILDYLDNNNYLQHRMYYGKLLIDLGKFDEALDFYKNEINKLSHKQKLTQIALVIEVVLVQLAKGDLKDALKTLNSMKG